MKHVTAACGGDGRLGLAPSHRRGFSRAAALLVTAALGVAVPACGSAVGGAVLGVELNNLLNKVQTVIQQASVAANGSVVIAGTTLQSTIDNARVAWGDLLNTSLDKLDQTTSRRLDELRALTERLTQSLHQQGEDITVSAQQLMNQLPFTNKQPQVRSYSPNFVAAGSSSALSLVPVRVNGNFFYAKDPHYRPTLLVGGLQPLAPTEATTAALTFEVPVLALAGSAPTGIAPTSLRLDVPYPTGVVFTKTRVATFQLALGLVPSTPGAVTFTPTLAIPQTNIKKLASPGVKIDSDPVDEDQEASVGPVYRDAGCVLRPDTAQFVVDWSRGREKDSWQWRWVTVTQYSALAWEKAINHSWLGGPVDGGIEGHITIDEACNYTVPVDQQPTAITLRWGDQVAIPIKDVVRWQVLYSAFDGRTEQVAANYADKFLTISCCAGGAVTIAAARLNEVRW